MNKTFKIEDVGKRKGFPKGENKYEKTRID